MFLAGELIPGTLENERAQSAHQLIAGYTWDYSPRTGLASSAISSPIRKLSTALSGNSHLLTGVEGEAEIVR